MDWIADPDGRELNPIFAQGYPQQLVNRLGTIPRDAENATAAAFRTSLLQTVLADSISGGFNKDLITIRSFDDREICERIASKFLIETRQCARETCVEIRGYLIRLKIAPVIDPATIAL